MNRKQTVGVLFVLALAACGTDGGQRGTGITTAFGNVARVEGTSSAGVAGIHVSIEGTAIATDTDAQGRFTMRGRFDGPTTVRFERVADALSASLALNVPAGGTLTLRNIGIDAHGGTRTESSAVVFEGRVLGVDCAAGRVTLASTQASPMDTDTYVVVLQSSTLRDSHGTPRVCSDLRPDDRLAVDGFFADDGTIGNATVIVEG